MQMLDIFTFQSHFEVPFYQQSNRSGKTVENLMSFKKYNFR
jgi:hypothetical protein